VQTYVSWEELEDSVEAPEPTDAAPANPKLAELVAERARLEQRLLELLGKAPPSAETTRDAARFPMPVHTVESRIEDRRAARADEQARALARRALERVRIAIRELNEREEAKRQRERALIQAQTQKRHDASIQQERHRDWLRTLHSQESIRQRWADQRATALRVSGEARHQSWALFEQRSQNCRERALLRYQNRRVEDAALAARLDRRAARTASRDEIGQRRTNPSPDGGNASNRATVRRVGRAGLEVKFDDTRKRRFRAE
jgi:hypothetical protein